MEEKDKGDNKKQNEYRSFNKIKTLALINLILSLGLCYYNSFLVIFEILIAIMFIIILAYLIKKCENKNYKKIVLIVFLFIIALVTQYGGYRQKRIECRVKEEAGYIFPKPYIYIDSKISEIKETKLKDYLESELGTNGNKYVKQINATIGIDDGFTRFYIIYKDTNGISKEKQAKSEKIKEVTEEIKVNDEMNNKKIYICFFIISSIMYIVIYYIQISEIKRLCNSNE